MYTRIKSLKILPLRRSPTAALGEIHRIEALCDGVFAIIITLLVLEIHRPHLSPGHLTTELLKGWPSYLAYAVGFLYVGVVWLNHHYMYEKLQASDLPFIWLNLLVLGTVALIPFPTGVLAEAFRDGDLADQKGAVVLYAFIAALMSAAWVPLFYYLHKNPALSKSEVVQGTYLKQLQRPLVGMLLYLAAAGLGWFVHPVFAVVVFIFMAVYYALTSQGID